MWNGAEENLEVELDLQTVEAIFAGEKVTNAMVAKLNPERNVEAAQKEITEMSR